MGEPLANIEYAALWWPSLRRRNSYSEAAPVLVRRMVCWLLNGPSSHTKTINVTGQLKLRNTHVLPMSSESYKLHIGIGGRKGRILDRRPATQMFHAALGIVK